MKFKKSIMLFASLSLFTTISASAASPIVEKMKKADQQRLEAEKNKECGMGCRAGRDLYMGIGPVFYEMQLKNDTLTPEQVYILDKVKDILQKESEIIDLYKANERAPYNKVREDVQATILDMLTYTSKMKEVSANDVKVLTYAVSKARELYVDASWQESWVADRDTEYLYAYMNGVVAVLDRFQHDLPQFADYIPGGSFSEYSWAHSVAMRSIAEFTKSLESNYHDTVQELYDTYTRNYLNLVQADQSLNLEYKIRNATDIYSAYKTQLGTAFKNNMIATTQEVIINVLKQNNAEIKENERYYQDYSQAIEMIDAFVGQKEIAVATKKQLRLQWYQSFMAGLDKLDVSIYNGEFYWYVDYLVNNKLKQFAQAHPAEMKKLAAKLLTKVKAEKNPKDAAAYKKAIATLTKLSR
ncbi:hypothetical protein [Brevibacillus thermoruber]|uniref:hypothetical protein n=1 Tax=Brevibacillus thermoruber TaxID=33942 RepID=UPI00041C9B17|nr:hypothetical protein [Brevibacillus thermoruber]